jgi:hypothetical protein
VQADRMFGNYPWYNLTLRVILPRVPTSQHHCMRFSVIGSCHGTLAGLAGGSGLLQDTLLVCSNPLHIYQRNLKFMSLVIGSKPWCRDTRWFGWWKMITPRHSPFSRLQSSSLHFSLQYSFPTLEASHVDDHWFADGDLYFAIRFKSGCVDRITCPFWWRLNSWACHKMYNLWVKGQNALSSNWSR